VTIHIEAWQMCVKDDRILVVERTHADDFDGLMYAAQSALRQALDDGGRKGFEPGDWLKQSAECHLQHAQDHVAAIKTFPEFSREDVSHAICRLLMLWARVEPPPGAKLAWNQPTHRDDKYQAVMRCRCGQECPCCI
jgi:hypothetical protein